MASNKNVETVKKEEKAPVIETKASVVEKKEAIVDKKETVTAKKETVADKKDTVKKETAPAKKETVAEKKETATEKKEPVAEKKEIAAPKKAADKKVTAENKGEVVQNLYIQHNDNDFEYKDIFRRVREAWVKLGNKESDIKTVNVYVVPNHMRVYYVINEEAKEEYSFDL
ncbi:MAG: DUF6465 family protein [Oscillospiraceae bacterium]|jgi:hypothetical protein|nr:DUF6465 family protein [Oscillospiraceae bacterium]